MIAPVVTDIANLSLFISTYPDCLKIAQVVLLYKEGDKADPSNYRPISILPVINKLFEVLLRRGLLAFLNKTDCSYRRQYGFRKKSGTHTAMYELNSDEVCLN